MKLSDWKSAEKMIERGFELQCGQHAFGLCGYFATFIDDTMARKTCDECGNESDLVWEAAAHHLVLSGAIKMAIKIADGERVNIPDSKDFE